MTMTEIRYKHVQDDRAKSYSDVDEKLNKYRIMTMHKRINLVDYFIYKAPNAFLREDIDLIVCIFNLYRISICLLKDA